MKTKFNPTHIAVNEREKVEIVTPLQWLGGMALVRREDGYEWYAEVEAIPTAQPERRMNDE